MTQQLVQQIRDFALQFTRALVLEQFEFAFTYTGAIYRTYTSPAALEKEYRRIIFSDWGPMTHMEADLDSADVLTDSVSISTVAPEDQPIDIAYVYVSLAGQHYPYSEALYILVTLEDSQLRVGDVNFGRP